jgi:hypothetical protein
MQIYNAENLQNRNMWSAVSVAFLADKNYLNYNYLCHVIAEYFAMTHARGISENIEYWNSYHCYTHQLRKCPPYSAKQKEEDYKKWYDSLYPLNVKSISNGDATILQRGSEKLAAYIASKVSAELAHPINADKFLPKTGWKCISCPNHAYPEFKGEWFMSSKEFINAIITMNKNSKRT